MTLEGIRRIEERKKQRKHEEHTSRENPYLNTRQTVIVMAVVILLLLFFITDTENSFANQEAKAIQNKTMIPETCGINIPIDSEVDAFCKSKGYRFGWVESSCGKNQVMCAKTQLSSDKNVGKYDVSVCIDWYS